jgi:YqaJ-like viral recombinase domain
MICSCRASFEKLTENLTATKLVQTAAMKYGIDNEPIAAKVYARTFARNTHSVGLVINPTVFFIGYSPDRRVHDEDGCEWGQLEIECTQSTTVADLT